MAFDAFAESRSVLDQGEREVKSSRGEGRLNRGVQLV